MDGRKRVLAAVYITVLFSPIARPQSGGQAEVSAQGYYQADQQQPLSDTSGLSMRFQEFVPKFGLLTGALENYGTQGRWQTGENYLQLQGLPWQGYRWTLTGGDFRTSSLVTVNPFTNVFYPELSLRGVKIQTTRGNASYSLFYGIQTLSQGPRIPFRIATGERAAGGTVQYRVGERLRVGFRLLRLTADPSPKDSFLFPLNRRFDAVDNASVQANYNVLSHVRVFVEGSVSMVTASPASPVIDGSPLSLFTGAAYETDRLTVRANYANQGVFYLPLAGYFAGDRRGPFGEVRFRPFKRVELFGSASQYRNNLEHDDREPTFNSTSESAGVSLSLPSRLSVSGQLNLIGFQSSQPGTVASRSNNQQWSTTLSRPTGKHNLRLTYRDMKFDNGQLINRQISREFEDLVSFGRFVVGGSARYDTTLGNGARNTFFTRGTAQVRLKKLTAYASVDVGRDEVNKSVFATNAMNSSIAGASIQLPGKWSFQGEASRNTLAVTLNPANIFLLQGQGIAVPTTLGGLNQWTLFIRLSKQLHWGKALPSEGLDQYTVERIPITGIITGEVYEVTGEGKNPVAGIPIMVDGARTAISDRNGFYRIEGVPEGPHETGLRLEELPANFEAGSRSVQTAPVSTRRVNRLDFEVIRLSEVCGNVYGAPEPGSLDNLVIRLRPTERYTTPESDGSFCFHNQRSGSYEVELDVAGLPSMTRLDSPAKLSVSLDFTRPQGPIEFRLVKVIETKPVRRKSLDGPAATGPVSTSCGTGTGGRCAPLP